MFDLIYRTQQRAARRGAQRDGQSDRLGKRPLKQHLIQVSVGA